MSPRLVTAALLGVQVAFQAGLAAGAPWGRAAYGGRHDVLPTRLRRVSTVAATAYAGAAVALASDRLTPPTRRRVLTAVAGFTGVGALPNAISRSPVERLWAPYCALVALTSWRGRREI